jgi:hypothetical protein
MSALASLAESAPRLCSAALHTPRLALSGTTRNDLQPTVKPLLSVRHTAQQLFGTRAQKKSVHGIFHT